MQRYICIHGHFYQPPRENPWLEAVEVQESAYPYHDWNARITAECYAPNTRARILDDEGRITAMVNNYARTSYNFGPTLLSWLEHQSPDVYRQIIDSDRESIARFGGHGAAIAQAYGHIILPLANDRDKETQVVWGIRDFERRFGRKPEGMWLPEAAADTASLEALARHGIRFTILAPRQAARTRKIGGKFWHDCHEGIDPSRAYRCTLPSGRSIALFFYDGPISQGVAFERLLQSGEKFSDRLLQAFDDNRSWPQLAHIATDGETYGHHHRHGEMALAYALHRIESQNLATITVYGEFLEKHPPTHEVQIHESSSWSCVHGVERWRSDCGCNTGGHPNWNQAWRGPLRDALDWLRDSVATAYESAAAERLRDPWLARDHYIDVVLDRSPDSLDRFFERHATDPADTQNRTHALKLLELQRHAMLMYTSCGWFFDELSGIETTQVVQYAGRVVQLAQDCLGLNLEPGFLERLALAKSNLREHKDGRRTYLKFVKPGVLDLRRVGAHYAISSLFDDRAETDDIYAYTAQREDLRTFHAGRAALAIGRARLTSKVTLESELLTFGVFHLGDHTVSGGVRPFRGEGAYESLAAEASDAFRIADFARTLRLLDTHFEGSNYTLSSLFRDEQHRVVRAILDQSLRHVETTYRSLYEQYAPLVRHLSALNIPAPRRMVIAAEFVINDALRDAIAADPPDFDAMRRLLAEAHDQAVPLDSVTHAFALSTRLARLIDTARENPADPAPLRHAAALVALLDEVPFDISLSEAQNRCWSLLQTERPRKLAALDQPASGPDADPSARDWLDAFDTLCAALRISLP